MSAGSPKRRNRIAGQFSARLIDLMESPAYRVLSQAAHKALSRIEIELAHHGGNDNGKLPVTFDDFADYGVHRSAIGPALAELEALGFIVITEHGKMARAAEYRRPNRFLLATRPAEGDREPTDGWRRFKTLEEAQAVADAARKKGAKLPGSRSKNLKAASTETVPEAVRNPYQRGQITGTEVVPLRGSKTVPQSISRDISGERADAVDADSSRRRTNGSIVFDKIKARTHGWWPWRTLTATNGRHSSIGLAEVVRTHFWWRVAERYRLIRPKRKDTSMSNEQKPMTANEQLTKGWELTQESVAVAALPIPHYVHFQIDGRRQIRVTRVAQLDELAHAIGAIDEDIGRLVQGTPALNYDDFDIEQLRQEKAALIELQERVGQSGRPGSTTVIEALFPDIPVKKKTTSEKAEIERWLAIRKEAGLKIDPETAEVDWSYGQTLDPYGVCDEWELPEEFHQVGREYFARSPGSDIWVHFGDLPEETRSRLRTMHSRKLAFPAGLEGLLE